MKAWLRNGKIVTIDGKPILCDECPCEDSSSSSSGPSNCHLHFTADDPDYPTGAEGHYYPNGDPHSTSTVWMCKNGNYMQYEERWVVGIPYYRWWVYYISTESEEWVSTEVGPALPDDDPTTWVSPHCGLGDLVFFHACYVCEDESSSSDSSSSDSSSSGGFVAGYYEWHWTADVRHGEDYSCCANDWYSTLDEVLSHCATRETESVCGYCATEADYNALQASAIAAYNEAINRRSHTTYTPLEPDENCVGYRLRYVFEVSGETVANFSLAVPDTFGGGERVESCANAVVEDDVQ